MDRETLSHYGWIVILVLILAVLLAFATPFGSFIADGFKATYAGFDMVGNGAMDVVMNSTGGCTHNNTEIKNVTDDYTGDTVCDKCGTVLEEGKHIVPEGGQYTTADGTVYKPGDEMPQTAQTGDKYKYKMYEYGYNMKPNGYCEWRINEAQNGWGVDTISNYGKDYGEMLHEINGKPITSNYMTFYWCTSLTTIPKIPETVCDMDYMFYGCSSLLDASYINIPVGVTKLNNTFERCSKLTDVGLPAIPQNVTQLSATFKDCTAIKDLSNYNIPGNVETAYHVFYGCRALTELPTVSEGVKRMASTFRDCKSLVDASDFVVPSTVETIEWVFSGCSSLIYAPDLTKANNLTSMWETFSDCTALEYAPILPMSLVELDSSFANCQSLKYFPNGFTIGPNVTSANAMFSRCYSITILPESFAIGEKVGPCQAIFANCTSLTGKIKVLAEGAYSGFVSNAFLNVDFKKQNINLISDCSRIYDMGITGNHYCRTCKGKCLDKATHASTCIGGFATCQEKAKCQWCNKEYGDFGNCVTHNGICTLCGKTDLKIETKHMPYANGQNYVVLGTWDYSSAKSVNITITYQTEYISYDWCSITEGNDYVSGSSYNETRNYLNTNGSVVSAKGYDSSVKFADWNKKTITFNNVNMLSGSVIFNSNTHSNSYYGVQVIVTPNY